MKLIVNLNNSKGKPHGHMLEISFATGDRLRIRLAQGVSYWRAAHNIGAQDKFHNLDEPAIDKQVINLLRSSVRLECDQHTTQLFVSVSTLYFQEINKNIKYSEQELNSYLIKNKAP